MVFTINGCGGQKVMFVRSGGKLPDEDVILSGQARLAQDNIKVNVYGTDDIGSFTVPKSERKPGFFGKIFHKTTDNQDAACAGYVVLHPTDAAKMIRNTQILQNLAADAENDKPLKDKIDAAAKKPVR